MIGLEAVRDAAIRVAGHIHRTPIVRSRSLSVDTDCDGFLKLELFQKTGSFKPRGALYNLMRRDAGELARGVVTISAGNHAQGLAYAAQRLGLAATVVMPANASPAKAEAARGYGAEVILHGDVHQAFEKVRQLERDRGLVFIHPFDHEHTIAGQGTVGIEIIEDLPDGDPEVVVVPIGGGGLIAGVSLAVKSLRPDVRVIGVEPTGADAMVRSRAAGRAVRLESIDTIADGLAAPFIGELNFEIAERCVDSLVTVTDDEMIEAIHFLLTRVKVVAEPAGAAAVAALRSGKIDARGKRVVCVVSGGNADPSLLAGWLGRRA